MSNDGRIVLEAGLLVFVLPVAAEIAAEITAQGDFQVDTKKPEAGFHKNKFPGSLDQISGRDLFCDQRVRFLISFKIASGGVAHGLL